MRRLWYVTIILIVLSISSSCTEEQMQQVDKAAETTKKVTVEGEKILESPTGQYVPPDIKFIVVLAGALASGLANAWQEWRLKTMTKTTKAIVKGIEKSTDPEAGHSTDEIKNAIADEMKAAKVYDRGNKIVDRLKIS